MKLEKVGTNSAGYPEYKRVKESDDSKERAEHEPKKVSRRGFLGLIAGAGAATAVGLPKIFEETEVKQPESSDIDSESITKFIEENELQTKTADETVENSEKESNEGQEVFSESKYFNQLVEKYKKRYEKELHDVEPFAKKPTVGDRESRSRIEYVSQMLEVDGVSDVVLEELRKQITGICFEESRYDGDKKSGAGAVGVLQIMPATWEEHGNTKGNPLSLVEQVEAAGSLMSQAVRYLEKHCTDDFLAIQTEFFHGDTEAFEKCFLVPVIINAYNAGQGNMRKVVEWFGRTYGTEEKTRNLLGQEELLSGYDIFLAMARSAKEGKKGKKPAQQYGDHASAYTTKVYGATRCLEENNLFVTKA